MGADENDVSDAWSMCSDMSYQSLSDFDHYSRNFDLTNGSPINTNNFNVMHFNINSITAPNRIEELSYFCTVLCIDVLICTESKLDATIPCNLLAIQGMHEPIRKDRNRNGGGTIMWISQKLVFKRRQELEENHFEHIWADVKVGQLTFAINAFYRPPSDTISDENTFLETAETILSKLTNLPNPIIASDFNFGNCYCKYPILEHKSLDNRAPDLFESYGLCQLIDIPTRVTSNTTSLIDLFFVRNKDIVLAHGTLPKIADHDGILCSFNIQKQKTIYRTKTINDWKNTDQTGLLNYIKSFNFDSQVFNLDVQSQTEKYSHVLTEALSKFVPRKTIKIRSIDEAWTNTFTRLLLRKKNRKYQIFKKANSQYLSELCQGLNHENITRLKNKKDSSFEKSRQAANNSNKANKRAKENYFNAVNSTMQNPNISAKKKFSILLRLMKSNKFTPTPPLVENEDTVNDALEKSNLFNDYFTSKATVENPDDEPPDIERIEEITPIQNINTSPIEVARILRQLKKSKQSHCGVPGIFLDMISTPISFSMSRLFNNLFEVGHYPDIWKLSHVTPVFKKSGLKCDKSNFRPISILPTISKACEAVIHSRLLSHCTEFNIISDRQAAYLKGDSTINQILYMVHKIRSAWGNKSIAHGIFLDIKGAFDKIWHKGLLKKLNQIGVEGSLLSLFSSYLTNRRQVVVVDGQVSEEKEVLAGCPQGSKLGPLLFIIYINDLINDLECELFLFADDTSLIAFGKDPTDTANIISRDLQKIENWAEKWKVTFNADKSKDIIFSKQIFEHQPNIIFTGEIIKRVNVVKHLGVMLTCTLDWTEQINYVCLRANRKLSCLRTVRYLSRKTLDLLYKLTIRSLIDYGLIIYYNNLTQKQTDRLNQIQYKAAKIVTGALHYSSRVKLENELGWESLKIRFDFLGLTLFDKIARGMTRPLIRNCMTQLNITNVNTRIKTEFKRHKYLNVNHQRSFFPYFTVLWNNTPERGTNDFDTFKTKLKERLKPKRIKFYSVGSKFGNKLITSLRVGRSYLNAHAFTIGLADSPECNCGAKQENSAHILLSCPLYESERRILLGLVEQQIQTFKNFSMKTKVQTLLFGHKPENDNFFNINIKITLAVQNFLLKIKRFEV